MTWTLGVPASRKRHPDNYKHNSFGISADDIHVYDCYHGIELKVTTNNDATELSVSFAIEADGYGAILATMNDTATDAELQQFLSTMTKMTQLPISAYSADWHYLQQHMQAIPATPLYSAAPTPNMVRIPLGVFYFVVGGVEIEGDDDCVDVQLPSEMHAQRNHAQYMTVDEFFMDRYPVTCREYQQYLNSSGYRPADAHNWLRNWPSTEAQGRYPSGYANKPVTYVGIQEARAYCAWAGKRLPHSYEWQFAAQGGTRWLFPWGNGNKNDAGVKYPKTSHARTIPGPEDVDAYSPAGDSMFGVSDLVGNVWQFTDEFADEHTRAGILRGSANYYPSTDSAFDINWYFPQALQLNEHGKYYLMSDSYERAGTLGFRCAADAVQPVMASSSRPYNWNNGSGVYCTASTVQPRPVLCGALEPALGFNDLTAVGAQDWVQFGLNAQTSDAWRIVRKDVASSAQMITAFEVKSGGGGNDHAIYSYDGNSNAYLWSDGQPSHYRTLAQSNASTTGIYMSPESGHGGNNAQRGFELNVEGLRGGLVYRVRVYVGVWNERGHLRVAFGSEFLFEDVTLSGLEFASTENAMYELVLDLTTFADNAQTNYVLLIEWLLRSGAGNSDEGNITWQAIAVEIVSDNK